MACAADITESASKTKTDSDIADLINNTERLVIKMQEKKFATCSTKVDAAIVCQQLQQLAKTKQDIKDKFHKTVTMNSFMQNLSKPRDQWDVVASQNEEELRAARATLKDVQHRFDDKKAKIMQFNMVTAKALALYEENLKSLKERLQCLENTCQELEVMKGRLQLSGGYNDSLSKEIQAQLTQCSADIKKARKDVLHVENKKAQTLLRLSRIKDDIRKLHLTTDTDQECMDAQCLTRLQDSISSMEAWGGVTCEVPNPGTIVVGFPPRQSAASASVSNDSGDNDPILQVTLTFKDNSFGTPRLINVQSNIDSLDLADLWGKKEEGVDSIPTLIQAIKLRWFSHGPLLSEINRLRNQYAIDWIQKEGVMRVIVGKGGGIVCSLSIPTTYPHQGDVILTSIIGINDNVDMHDLKPSAESRLEDWVHFLVDKFGKP